VVTSPVKFATETEEKKGRRHPFVHHSVSAPLDRAKRIDGERIVSVEHLYRKYREWLERKRKEKPGVTPPSVREEERGVE